jgi:hypothetical protein
MSMPHVAIALALSLTTPDSDKEWSCTSRSPDGPGDAAVQSFVRVLFRALRSPDEKEIIALAAFPLRVHSSDP